MVYFIIEGRKNMAGSSRMECGAGEAYGAGNIIGCGLDKKGTLFFTKNGTKITCMFFFPSVDLGRLLIHQAVGNFPRLIVRLFLVFQVCAGGGIEANLGSERFAY